MYNLFLDNDIMDYIVNGFNLNIKFSNLNIHKLSNMSVEMIRKLLLDEIYSIKNDSNNQKVRLQKLIDKIFTYQPDELISKDNKTRNWEQRIYGDIIATKGFLDDELVRNFILNDYVCSNKNQDKYKLLKKIISFYDERSADSIEKFNYCFRNSSSFSFHLLNDDEDLFDMILIDRNLSLFDKETLCQIFRFFSEIYSIKSFFEYEKDSDKALYIISLMCDYVNMNIGHNSELIDAIVRTNQECKAFKKILVEYYDRYVGNKDNEVEYRRKVGENYPSILRELTNYMFMYAFDYYSDNHLNKCDSLDIFLLFTSKNRENNSINILGREVHDGLLKNKCNDFLLKIDTDERLELFKKAYLLNVYGITMNMARYICDRYGVYIEALEKSIKKEDRGTLEILKAIKNIYYLDLKDEEKINLLQKSYMKYLKRYKLKCNNPVSVILIGLLNKMYINTYNSLLFSSKKAKFIEYDDDVRVVDASNKFKMIVTELNGDISFIERI